MDKEMTLDEQFASIENILKELERDDIGIEEALEKYTQAKQMTKDAANKIDMVEKAVLELSPCGDVEVFDTDSF